MDPTRIASDPTGASSPTPGAPNPADATQTAPAVAGSATSASAPTGPVSQATTASDSTTQVSQPDSGNDNSDVDAVLSQGIVSPRRTVVNTMEMPDLNAIQNDAATSSQPTTATAQSVATPTRRFAPPKRAAIPSAKFVQEDGTTKSSLKATPNAPTPATNPATVATGSAATQSVPTPAPAPAPRPSQNPMVSAQDRGDIILPSGRPSGGKKLSKFAKLAIAGAAAVVLLLGVAGVALLAQQSQNSGEGSDYTAEETVDAWNSFFTYLVYGESSTGIVPLSAESALTSDFAFAFALSANGGVGLDYYTELMSLLTPAANAVIANFSDLSDEVDALATNLTILNNLEQVTVLGVEGIIEQFYQQVTTSGASLTSFDVTAVREATTAYVQEYYSALNNSGDELRQSYYDALIEYTSTIINMLPSWEIYLCIENNVIDMACAAYFIIDYDLELETATAAYALLTDTISNVKTAATNINIGVNAGYFTVAEESEL